MLISIFNLQERALITFIASFLIVFMVGGVLYLWLFRKKIHFSQVVLAFSAMLFAWLLTELVKKFFPVSRPFMVNGQNPLTLTWPLDSSFPSDHASSAFALWLSLRKADKRLFFLYFIFAVLVSMGRVLSHVHYFLDIFVGALIGILTVIVLEKLGMEKFLKKILA